MQTAAAVERFLTAKRAAGRAPATTEGYRYKLGIVGRVYETLPTDPTDIEGFLTRFQVATTRDAHYRILRNLYSWLAKRKLIAAKANPMPHVERPRCPRRVARGLTPGELRALLVQTHHPPPVRAFLLLLADTGARLSEALTVSAGTDTATVTGKTGAREVPISPGVSAMVHENQPWPWQRPDSAGRAVRRAFARAGITGQRASAHTLRHTFVRLWTGDESLLVGIMGWTSPAMLKVYRPYDLAKAQAQHRASSPLHLLD